MNDPFSRAAARHFPLYAALLLLTAVFLRTFLLNEIPPGLTHDEADHGLTALQILDGAREIYFTIGYGREPLFDYALAGLMALLGPSYWVGRLTAVFFSLLALAGMIGWTRRAFNPAVALLTGAGLVVGFWPLLAARQMLRSIALPALFVLALLAFWRGLQSGPRRLRWFMIAGLFLGGSFYTYIPARGLWALFPGILLYLGLLCPTQLRGVWRPALGMLLLAALLGTPLAVYLLQNPGAEVRIDELSAPLALALQGDLGPLWANIRSGVGIFTAAGDTAWRYNLPGRPLLPPLQGILFYGGLGLALWGGVRPFRRQKQPHDVQAGVAGFSALVWLFLGLGPVLITGAELSITQAMGLQPVLYLFPALSMYALLRLLGRAPVSLPPLGVGLLVVLLFVGTATESSRAYFVEWAHAPEVRVQYESAITAAVRYVAAAELEAAAISTITPGPYHSPALAQMVIGEQAAAVRWFDGRAGLVIPAQDGIIISTGFAPLAPPLQALLGNEPADTISLRADDLDRPLHVYPAPAEQLRAELAAAFAVVEPAVFGDAVTLRGFLLPQTVFAPGDTVEIVSWWEVQAPLAAEARLFTHFAGADGVPLAQADRLDVPAAGWIPGDHFLQLHTFVIPIDAAAGEYALTTGLYRCLTPDCGQTERYVTAGTGEDALLLTPVTISEE